MQTDLLIIGGGLTARRAAAIAARGMRVTLLSDGAGASPFIHGLNVPLDPADSEELFFRDTMQSGAWQNDPTLVRALTKGSLALKDALPFDRKEDGSYALLRPLGASVARVAGIEGRTGASLLSALRTEARYTELPQTRALSLLKEDGRVVGALCFDKKTDTHFCITSRMTLLASGGFGALFPFSTNSRDIGGDGIAMAYRAGASLRDLEFIQFEPSVAVAPKALIGKSIITTMFFEGAVIRNARGERFLDEHMGKDALSLAIARELARGGGTENGGVFFDMRGVPRELLKGKYRDYTDRYASVGIDVAETPVEIAPGAHTTMGGVMIDAACHTTLPGLLAAGEAAGGLHGANRLGGNAGTEVLVFGDIAGETALREAMQLPLGSPRDMRTPDTPCDTAAGYETLHRAAKLGLGILRSEKTTERAIAMLDTLLRDLPDLPDSYSATRLRNDAITLRLAAIAAHERRGTVGAHVREDSVAEEKRYTIILTNGKEPERRPLP